MHGPLNVKIPLSEFCSADAELAGPTQSFPTEIRSLNQAFFVLCQYVILAIQDKRVHVVCRRLLILVSHYLNNGRKRTSEV